VTEQTININNNIGILRQTIRERMPELRRRYGIKSLGIFGSYVHGR
jgi:predicted nucleotidyltransferase